MSRYSAGMTAAGAGTSLRPILGIVSAAAVGPKLREIGIFNTTAVACTYRLVAFTGGTAGTGQTERRFDRAGPAASCAVSGLWTADVTSIDEDCGFRAVLGAAIGSGAIFTFGEAGLEGDVGTTKGLGLVPVGTGQICEVYFVWDE